MPKRTLKQAAMRPGVSELRALAHPLRIRVLELFAEAPRTTMQVAAALGQPPTRLYHHVNALEKAGLLRVKETRANRGTTEKYYEVVAQRFAGADATRSPKSRAANTALAGAAIEQAKLEATAALTRQLDVKPLVARVAMVASAKKIAQTRKRLVNLLHELEQFGSGDSTNASRPSGEPRERWAVTITFAPTWPAPASDA